MKSYSERENEITYASRLSQIGHINRAALALGVTIEECLREMLPLYAYSVDSAARARLIEAEQNLSQRNGKELSRFTFGDLVQLFAESGYFDAICRHLRRHPEIHTRVDWSSVVKARNAAAHADRARHRITQSDVDELCIAARLVHDLMPRQETESTNSGGIFATAVSELNANDLDLVHGATIRGQSLFHEFEVQLIGDLRADRMYTCMTSTHSVVSGDDANVDPRLMIYFRAQTLRMKEGTLRLRRVISMNSRAKERLLLFMMAPLDSAAIQSGAMQLSIQAVSETGPSAPMLSAAFSSKDHSDGVVIISWPSQDPDLDNFQLLGGSSIIESVIQIHTRWFNAGTRVTEAVLTDIFRRRYGTGLSESDLENIITTETQTIGLRPDEIASTFEYWKLRR